MAKNHDNEKTGSDLWEFISIDEYRLPEEPVSQRVRKGVRFFRRFFDLEKNESESPLRKEEELQKLPPWQMERVVPEPDWQDAVESLEIELEKWLNNGNTNHPVIVLVGPPHSGHIDILKAWAAKHSWSMPEPPTADQILIGEIDWLSKQRTNDDPWVFPVLESAFLRHLSGLGLVRNFLNQAFAGSLGRGIIGCGSWAWTFLRQIWHGHPPIVLTLQAFNEDRLAASLNPLASSSSQEQPVFRELINGSYILPRKKAEGDDVSSSDFLKSLAAHSRGILGVALGIWRENLEAEPGEELPEEAKEENRQLPYETVWVNPWKQRKEPALPESATHDEAFVLQSLLMHHELPFDLLRRVLPISTNRAMETVFLLENARLIERHDGLWRVSPAGYPAVRSFLKTMGYFVDKF